MNWLKRTLSAFHISLALFRLEKWVGLFTLAYASIYFSLYVFVFRPAFLSGHLLPASVQLDWANPATFLPVLRDEFAVFFATYVTFFADYLITQKVLDRFIGQKRTLGQVLSQTFANHNALILWSLLTTVYFHWVFPIVFRFSHGTAYFFTLIWFFGANFFTQVLAFEGAGFKDCVLKSMRLCLVTYKEQIVVNLGVWAMVWAIPTLVDKGQGTVLAASGMLHADPQVACFTLVAAFSMVYATVLYGSAITGMSPSSLFFKPIPTTVKGARMMSFKISRQKGVSLNQQLIEQIRHAILSKRLPSGEQLPSVRELSGKLNIHPLTIAKAYAELEKEGLVHTRWGKGTFVTEGRMKPQDYLQELVDEFLEKTLPLVEKPEQLFTLFEKRVKAKKG